MRKTKGFRLSVLCFPKNGFTLFETLVVISVLAILMIIGSNFFLSTLLGSSKVESLKEVRQNGEYASKIMEDTIKNSPRLVECSGGSFSPDPFTAPSITVEGNNKSLITLTLLKENDVVRIASVSGTVNYYLTSNKVTIDTFEIDCGQLLSGSPATITLDFSLRMGSLTGPREKYAAMSFDTTFSMRVPYEERVD